MKIYVGPFLTIYFEKNNDMFYQIWTSSPNSIETFKEEMLCYTSFYDEYKPSKSLWIHQKFTLHLDKEAFAWVEKQVNIPCIEFGNKKVAFVVGNDVLAHLTVIDSFKKEKSIINVSHFASEKEARKWLTETQ